MNGLLPGIYLLFVGIRDMVNLIDLGENFFSKEKLMDSLLKFIFFFLIPSFTLLSNSFRLLYCTYPCLAHVFGYYKSLSIFNIKTVLGVEIVLTLAQLLYHFWIALSLVAGISSPSWKMAYRYLFLFVLQFYITLNFLVHKTSSVFNYRLACKRNEIRLKKRILELSKS